MIGDGLRLDLRRRGHVIDWVRSAPDALTAIAAQDYELLLLDLGLPGGDGLDVLRQLRARGSSVPVLILTAREAVMTKVACLDAGADDYLVKPFDPDELAARIRVLQRRRAGAAGPVIEHRGLTLDPATHGVSRDGQPLHLSPREYAILQALIERPGQVLSRGQLEDRLYGWDDAVDSNAVEVHLSGLRKKLPAGTIQNVRGIGWRLAP
ncbi:two-component system, OmpR family, response regulator [Hydrocarboniphaga daqingensis]|uniref:Two-component system, OmpR family, response regulator n=2 Tax=Hydrocarboniphaga daqingensis TaxID=490188 RepID=A0A1M5JPZ3_9GAMM|nr:two-component system, OmpR family, response regulator [Hydrocarboniphaga daqingensis]